MAREWLRKSAPSLGAMTKLAIVLQIEVTLPDVPARLNVGAAWSRSLRLHQAPGEQQKRNQNRSHGFSAHFSGRTLSGSSAILRMSRGASVVLAVTCGTPTGAINRSPASIFCSVAPLKTPDTLGPLTI